MIHVKRKTAFNTNIAGEIFEGSLAEKQEV